MILDKAKMAHDYAIEMLKRGDPERSIAFDAWMLADTMQAEADKRVVKLPDVFFDTKSNEEWQPDWSQAHNGYDWFAIDKCGDAYFYTYKPYISNGYDIWADANYTFADGNSKQADSSFNYQGNWQDSLRKRPQ